MAIGKTFVQILGPHEQFPNNPGFPTLFLQKQTDVSRTVFGFNDGQGNTFSSFLVLEAGPGPGNRLSKIYDVSIADPSNGQALVYSADSSSWVNSTVSSEGGNGAAITNGTNTYTGGTFGLTSVNVSALTINSLTVSGNSTSNSLSATTISGGTLYSGSTNLYSIFALSGDNRFGSQSQISASNIDWNFTHFYKTLSANTIFTFSNTGDAKTIIVAVTNTTSNYTVTWPTVDWGSAGAPTQRTGATTDVYTFAQINSTIYGSVRQ